MRGIYCLLIKVNKATTMSVGSLGRLSFSKGDYIYVGSAQNSIEKRVDRHLRKKKKKFWHIDYLLSSSNAQIKNVFFKECLEKKEECITAEKISSLDEGVPNFGCSDCSCRSHLFRIGSVKSTISLNFKEYFILK